MRLSPRRSVMSDMTRSHPHRARSLGIVALVAVVTAGCPRPPFAPGPGGVITDPQVVLNAIEDRNAALRSAQGEARANVDTPKGGGGVDLYVLVEEPDRFRLEAIDFFGRPLGVLATDGVAFTYLDMQAGRFVEGPATPENVSRLLPVVVPADELASILLGEVPLLEHTASNGGAALTVDHDARAYRLELGPPDHRLQRVWLTPPALRPVAFEVADRPQSRAAFAPGAHRNFPGYRVEFSDFEGPLDRPRTIRLATLDRQFRVELKWRDRELDPAIDPALFTVQPPASP